MGDPSRELRSCLRSRGAAPPPPLPLPCQGDSRRLCRTRQGDQVVASQCIAVCTVRPLQQRGKCGGHKGGDATPAALTHTILGCVLWLPMCRPNITHQPPTLPSSRPQHAVGTRNGGRSNKPRHFTHRRSPSMSVYLRRRLRLRRIRRRTPKLPVAGGEASLTGRASQAATLYSCRCSDSARVLGGFPESSWRVSGSVSQGRWKIRSDRPRDPLVTRQLPPVAD